MMRKVAKILTWIGIAAWFVLMMAFMSDESEEVLCNRIDVILQDTVNNRFVTRTEIQSIVESSGLETRGIRFPRSIPGDLEYLLEKNSLCGMQR